MVVEIEIDDTLLFDIHNIEISSKTQRAMITRRVSHKLRTSNIFTATHLLPWSALSIDRSDMMKMIASVRQSFVKKLWPRRRERYDNPRRLFIIKKKLRSIDRWTDVVGVVLEAEIFRNGTEPDTKIMGSRHGMRRTWFAGLPKDRIFRFSRILHGSNLDLEDSIDVVVVGQESVQSDEETHLKECIIWVGGRPKYDDFYIFCQSPCRWHQVKKCFFFFFFCYLTNRGISPRIEF